MTDKRPRTFADMTREYQYVARRIDKNHSQNLGDYSITRRFSQGGYKRSFCYHFDSETGMLINRSAEFLPVIKRGSPIYTGCMKAIERLNAEEEHEVTDDE